MTVYMSVDTIKPLEQLADQDGKVLGEWDAYGVGISFVPRCDVFGVSPPILLGNMDSLSILL